MRQLVQQGKDFLKALTPSQRVSILLLSCAVVIGLIVLVTLTGRQPLAPLLPPDVEPEAVAEVVRWLTERAIPYEIVNGQVWVSRDRVKVLQAQIAQEEVIPTTEAYWDWVLETDLAETEKRFDVRYYRSRERDLANFIKGMHKDIVGADVRISPPVETEYIARPHEAKAAVRVIMRRGTHLPRETAKAIAAAVSHSVKHLNVRDVVIVDNYGRLHRVPEHEDVFSQLDERLRIKQEWERAMEKEALRILQPFSPQAVVKVEIVIDMMKSTERSREPNPSISALASEKTSTLKSTSKGGPVPPVGIVAELPVTVLPEGPAYEATVEQTEVERTYQPSEVEKFIERIGGEVKEKSMAVIMPVEDLIRPKFGGPPPTTDEEKQKVMEANIKEWVGVLKNSMGIGEDAKISILAVPFRKPEEFPEPTGWERAKEFLDEWGRTILLGMIILLALAVIYFIAKRALPDRLKEEIKALEEQVRKEEPTVELDIARVVDVRAEEILRRVKAIVQEKPDEAAGLVRRWIRKDMRSL